MLQYALSIIGAWILISGKVPGWITGKKDYEIMGNKARVVGFILSLTFPVFISFSAWFLVSVFGGDYYLINGILVVIDLIIVLILIRKFRMPVASVITQ